MASLKLRNKYVMNDSNPHQISSRRENYDDDQSHYSHHEGGDVELEGGYLSETGSNKYYGY